MHLPPIYESRQQDIYDPAILRVFPRIMPTETTLFEPAKMDYDAVIAAHANWLWNTWASRIDFPALTQLGAKATFVPPALADAWQQEMNDFTWYHLIQQMKDSIAMAGSDIHRENYTHPRLNDSRLVSFHKEYARDNRLLMVQYFKEAAEILAKASATLSFNFGFRPLINQCFTHMTTLAGGTTNVFRYEPAYYGHGFIETLNRLMDSGIILRDFDPLFMTLHASMFQTVEEGDIEPAEAQLNHFRFHKWHALNGYAIMWDTFDQWAILTHPHAIAPQFAMTRSINALPEYMPWENQLHWCYSDRISFYGLWHDETLGQDNIHPMHLHPALPHLGNLLLLMTQLLNLITLSYNVGKGATKPRWGVTPPNKYNGIHTLAMAPLLIQNAKDSL